MPQVTRALFFAFLVGMVTSRMRSMMAMVIGILVSAGGIMLLATRNGWFILGAIAVFSLGEMLASPTKMRYVAGIAPPGKKALYLGYVNATTGIGWSLGSLIAGTMYEETGDVHSLARKHLVEQTGMEASAVDALSKTDILPTLATRLGTTPTDAVDVLWATYDPWTIWPYFAGVGVVSMLGLVAFDLVTRRGASWEPQALAVITGLVTGLSYGAVWGVGFTVVILMWAAVGPKVRDELGRPAADWLDARPVIGTVAGGVGVLLLTAWMLVPPA